MRVFLCFGDSAECGSSSASFFLIGFVRSKVNLNSIDLVDYCFVSIIKR